MNPLKRTDGYAVQFTVGWAWVGFYYLLLHRQIVEIKCKFPAFIYFVCVLVVAGILDVSVAVFLYHLASVH